MPKDIEIKLEDNLSNHLVEYKKNVEKTVKDTNNTNFINEIAVFFR